MMNSGPTAIELVESLIWLGDSRDGVNRHSEYYRDEILLVAEKVGDKQRAGVVLTDREAMHVDRVNHVPRYLGFCDVVEG